MPDFRYRQATATLDVRGFEFRAAGRQPIDLGWRAAFPEWQPADEKGDEAQLVPPLRNGETAQLQNPKIETKETRPPPRYDEGTLIEAMQNAWRFVADEALRERLKEAKGIGTPATRAEIIGGLKQQGFLIAQGKNVVPTEIGLSLFGILEQADPALVDPGVTAQLECLLDDVVVGKQEMVGAIDAVCDVAQRIIGKLMEGAAAEGIPLLGAAVAKGAAAYQPTPAMKRFADSLVRQKGVKPPPGYKTSISICSAFLKQYAPKKADGEALGTAEPKSVSPAQLLYATKIALGKGVVIPDEAKANSAAMAAWIELEQRLEATQKWSQDSVQADEINSGSIDGTGQDIPKAKALCRRRCINTRPTKSGGRDAAADSLWQQGSRSRWCGHLSHPQYDGSESDDGKVISCCLFEARCNASELLEL